MANLETLYERMMGHTLEDMKAISSAAYLDVDSNGSRWNTLESDINSFIAHLPWWAFDSDLERDCLMFQVDSRGALQLLQILHVVRITTHPEKVSIWYKLDARHAKLEVCSVPKGRWRKVGLKSINRL
jgi:hypothetical protein|tara:strand:- start:5302 stop:5685 length:384 start_codon:yes stop_codon:yes gene_type:complete